MSARQKKNKTLMLGSSALLAILLGMPLLLNISWQESLTLLLASVVLVLLTALIALSVTGLWQLLRRWRRRN